jgi:hypothetical protein
MQLPLDLLFQLHQEITAGLKRKRTFEARQWHYNTPCYRRIAQRIAATPPPDFVYRSSPMGSRFNKSAAMVLPARHAAQEFLTRRQVRMHTNAGGMDDGWRSRASAV